MVRHLDGAQARVWTVNRQTNALDLQASVGLSTGPDGPAACSAWEKTNLGLIARNRTPQLNNQIDAAPAGGDWEWAKRQGIASFAGYPLSINEQVVGVLGLFGRSPFSDYTFHALAGIAESMALGIERMRMEAALRSSQGAMRLQTAALEAAANGVVITDLTGTIQWVNRAFTQLTGYSGEEAIGKNPRVLKSGQHAAPLYQGLWSTIRAGNVWKGEMVNQRKDGRLYHEEMTITPVKDSKGVVTHFIAIKQDITARKQAEEELQWKTALLQAQVDCAIDGILVVNEQNKQVLKNERFDEMWRIPKEIAQDPDDRKCVDFATSQTRHPKQFFEKVAFLYSNPEASSRDEVELLDGRVFDRYSAPIRNKNGKHYGRVWTFRDVTEQKKAETQMVELHSKLLDASREAGMAEVAVSVLHNVGNVLNSVNVTTSVLEDHLRRSRAIDLERVVQLLEDHKTDLAAFLTQDSKGCKVPEFLSQLARRLAAERETVRMELGALRKNIEHIKEIVTTQQRYAKISGVIESIDVTELIEDALRMNATSFAREDIRVVREYAVLPVISTDKHKVLQILVNLVRNAKYACNESGQVNKQVIVRTDQSEAEIRISIIDNGVGIPAENLSRIFNHGFTTRKEGHGFGLHSGALSAKELGGRLSARSDGPGNGASFTLELPKERPADGRGFGAPTMTGG